MTWWWWMLAGLALLGIEILTPGGFVAAFFGVAALLVGTLGIAGLALPAWAEWLIFSVASIATMLLFRDPLMRALAPSAESATVDALVGEVAVLLGDVAAGKVGKAELRGTTWSVRNDDARVLARGERARVEQVDGLTLRIRAEGPAGGST